MTDEVYGHCMAKSSAFLKQMSWESSSSLNIHYVLSFVYSKYSTLFRCTKKKKRKFIPKPGMVYHYQTTNYGKKSKNFIT